MAITINGSGTITGISTGGLPDGIVANEDIANTTITAGKLAASLDLSGKTVTLPAGTGGKILQVQQTVKTDTASHTSSSASFSSDVMTVTITPSHANNKILVTGLVHIGASNGQRCGVRVSNGGSALTAAIADTASLRSLASSAAAPAANLNSCIPLHFQYLHSPNATSQQTYGVQISVEGSQSVFLNRSSGDSDNNSVYRTASFLTVMEVAG